MEKTEDAMEVSTLADWVKAYARKRFNVISLPSSKLRQAVAHHSPGTLDEYPEAADDQELLEKGLGILTIVKLGQQLYAWSAVADRAEADTLQQLYSNPPYTLIRQELGIDFHWILLVNPEFMFTVEDLYEAHMDLLELEEQPQCVVVPV